jgi:hypothetical protein
MCLTLESQSCGVQSGALGTDGNLRIEKTNESEKSTEVVSRLKRLHDMMEGTFYVYALDGLKR